jgi:dCMP deaminase
MRRLTRDEYFLAIANIVAARATCDRLWCGCVLVLDGEIVSTGYNGAPSGLPECDEVGHLMVLGDDGREHCKRNVTGTPCENCLSELLKCGVRRVVCGAVYQNAECKEMTSRLITAFGAILEYHPMPDITLVFGTEVEEQHGKRIKITRMD